MRAPASPAPASRARRRERLMGAAARRFGIVVGSIVGGTAALALARPRVRLQRVPRAFARLVHRRLRVVDQRLLRRQPRACASGGRRVERLLAAALGALGDSGRQRESLSLVGGSRRPGVPVDRPRRGRGLALLVLIVDQRPHELTRIACVCTVMTRDPLCERARPGRPCVPTASSPSSSPRSSTRILARCAPCVAFARRTEEIVCRIARGAPRAAGAARTRRAPRQAPQAVRCSRSRSPRSSSARRSSCAAAGLDPPRRHGARDEARGDGHDRRHAERAARSSAGPGLIEQSRPIPRNRQAPGESY